ncbi:hypothetical protein JOF53_008073 [Crossiella equi]|uniref:DUF998 domain-containing protein n=1 Tax=Crossiella equi TaxID=130796 RepID=A0ABS5ARM0_9PSEU|nr:DUF998 domain-containing protein [Crossiella equi]MBP2479201.1 hypothetical protein [Crossiella equi]
MTTASRATARISPIPLARVLLAGAALVLGYLTVTYSVQVDPVWDPVSDYVFQSAPLFVGLVLLVVASGWVIAAGLRRDTRATVLFGLWVAGLLTVAAVPGNVSATVSTVGGEIHRLGGAVFLLCLPLAAMRVAELVGGAPAVWWLAVLSLVTAAGFGLSQVVPALPQGITQRLALIAQAVLLLALAPLTGRRVR